MVSFRKYTKTQILTEGNNRFRKIASMLDSEDLQDQFEQALSWLDQAIYATRGLLIKPEMIMGYNGGYFVDVTPYKIDVINNAYYKDTLNDQVDVVLPEVGLLPLILGGNTFANLTSIADYLALRSNLNMMNRQFELDGDYELWPIDEEGRQLLQVKNKNIMRIEFLPNIDRYAEEWYFYDFEYAALKDVLFDMCNLFNAEHLMSAEALGVGKEPENLAKYWQAKLDKDKKEFQDKVLVTALM